MSFFRVSHLEMHDIYLPLISYINFDHFAKVLQFLHSKGEAFKRISLERAVGGLWILLPSQQREVGMWFFLTSSQKREASRSLGKPNMCPLNLPGHSSLISDSFSGYLEIKRRAGLLLRGGWSKRRAPRW